MRIMFIHMIYRAENGGERIVILGMRVWSIEDGAHAGGVMISRLSFPNLSPHNTFLYSDPPHSSLSIHHFLDFFTFSDLR